MPLCTKIRKAVSRAHAFGAPHHGGLRTAQTQCLCLADDFSEVWYQPCSGQLCPFYSGFESL